MTETITRAVAEAMDAGDALGGCREWFTLPPGVIYLDGNSLGALPRTTSDRLARVVEDWGRDLIAGWNRHDWIGWPRRVGDRIARLIGAEPGEVIVADSTSINVFKLLAAALELNPGRRVILSEADNFPTDLHIAQGLRRLLDDAIDLRTVDARALPDALDKDVAVLMLTHVHYRTGAIHDMAALTAAARRAGALALWDLSHSAGAMPLALNRAGVDLAVGGSYKYLNGGPGAPAYLFVAERWIDRIQPALAGWMGHAQPFDFDTTYEPAPGIERLLVGTPPVLSLAALDAGLELFEAVDLRQVRSKCIALGELFRRVVTQECGGHGLRLASPADPEHCGSQVSYAHPDGYAIVQALIERRVIGDFRAPDVMRFGFAPLYVRYVDVFDAVLALRDVLQTRAWDQPRFRLRALVT
ncbi:MAG TPA: kynureninase [Candidatus Methylomirabilis sp.]|nr:kynureninase [Candidatus Methylomirabilis sp.]